MVETPLKKASSTIVLLSLFVLLFTLSGCGGAGSSGSDSPPPGPGPSAGAATLAWDPPTTNVDGTPLTNLAGYKIYYGTASGNYTNTADVGNATTYKIANLASGQAYYFAVTAYDTYGNESGYSNEVGKVVN